MNSARSHRQQVLCVLGISQCSAIGHCQADKTVLVTAKKDIEAARKTVVGGGAIVPPAVGVNSPSLTVVKIEATDDARLGEGRNGIGHQ